MRIHNRSASGWNQFDRMVRGGVPHALTIARALAASKLTIPHSPEFDARGADLTFYGPVHQAYRLCVLGRFLNVMETLRAHPLWECLRDCRIAQSMIVDECLADDGENAEAIIARLDSWLRRASAA